MRPNNTETGWFANARSAHQTGNGGSLKGMGKVLENPLIFKGNESR